VTRYARIPTETTRVAVTMALDWLETHVKVLRCMYSLFWHNRRLRFKQEKEIMVFFHKGSFLVICAHSKR